MDKKIVLMALKEYMENGPYAHRSAATEAFIETMADLIEAKGQEKKAKLNWKIHWYLAVGIGLVTLAIALVVRGL